MVDLNHIKVEINLQTRSLVGMDLLFSRTNRLTSTPVRVDAVPELEADFQKRWQVGGKMFINTNAPLRFQGRPPDKN